MLNQLLIKDNTDFQPLPLPNEFADEVWVKQSALYFPWLPPTRQTVM